MIQAAISCPAVDVIWWVWHDTETDPDADGYNEVGQGEDYQAVIYRVTALTGSGVQKTLTLDGAKFRTKEEQ